jgi:hypothetical protein
MPDCFIGVGQLVKTGPVVMGVDGNVGVGIDGNVGVGFEISMISLSNPEILPMGVIFPHGKLHLSNIVFTCCHPVMSTHAWHGQVWSK